MSYIDKDLIEDALALEFLFIKSGLYDHAKAIRIALKQAENDIIQEVEYGVEKSFSIIKSASNIGKKIALNDCKTNKDVINFFADNIEDIEKISGFEKGPSFINSSIKPIMDKIAEIINYIRDKNVEQNIDDKTKNLLITIKKITGDLNE